MKSNLYLRLLQFLGCSNIENIDSKFTFDPILLWTIVVTDQKIAKAGQLQFDYAYLLDNGLVFYTTKPVKTRNFDEICSTKEEAEKEALETNKVYITQALAGIASRQRDIAILEAELLSKKKWLADLEKAVK